MKNHYQVKIVLRKDKKTKSGVCPLYIKIMLNGKFFVKLSTGEKGEEKYWDSKSQIFRGKGYGLLNKSLHNTVIDIENFIAEKKALGKQVSKKDITNFYKNVDEQCYYRFFDETYTNNKLYKFSSSTVEKYMLLRRSLKEFKPKLKLNEIDLKFIHDFHYFLVKEKNIGKGGVWNREKNFKATIRYAYNISLKKDNPFKAYTIEKLKPKNEALTLEELNKIRDLDLSENHLLQKSKEMFLFSCYTGLRYGDVAKLKWGDLKNGMISIAQKKTKKPVVIPMAKEAIDIVAKNIKYKKERETVFSKISNQKINYKLKEIATLAKVDKKVSFHLARHTFGTILGRNQNAFMVMKLMGHTKISTSAIYVNLHEKVLRDTIKNVNFG